MAYARRVDSVSAACIAEVLACGGLWLDLSRAPGGIDGLILFRGKVLLVEWKTPKTKAGRVEMTDGQADLVMEGWPLRMLTSPADVRAELGVER